MGWLELTKKSASLSDTAARYLRTHERPFIEAGDSACWDTHTTRKDRACTGQANESPTDLAYVVVPIHSSVHHAQ